MGHTVINFSVQFQTLVLMSVFVLVSPDSLSPFTFSTSYDRNGRKPEVRFRINPHCSEIQ